MSDFDIAVVGGGIVGLTAGLALSNNGFKIAIIEPNYREPVFPEGYDPRSFALTITSIQILENLGVWPELDASRNAAIKHMSVWDANSTGSIEFSPACVGKRTFGVITENVNMLHGLQAKIKNQSNTTIVEQAARTISLESDRREIQLENGSAIRAKIVVCCDGGNSPMRAQLGIAANHESYQQRSLVCNVRTTKPHGNVARQVFHNEGPLAFLPLADKHQCAIVWTNSMSACEELMALSSQEFLARLNVAARGIVESVSLSSGRFDFPLFKMHVSRYNVERAVLVGDSAHLVHPLAGQGLNLGIIDAAALAHVLKVESPSEAKALLQKPHLALRRYSRWRAGDNQLMVLATDSLNKLFRRRERLLRSLRGAGLNATNKISPLMRLFTLHAMGQAGELPDLAKADYKQDDTSR